MATVSATIKVRGVKELARAFDALDAEVRGPIMRNGLEAGGTIVKDAAVANIHSRTGLTAKDIRLDVHVSEEQSGGIAGVGAPTRSYILRWLEFGTKAHDIPRKIKQAWRATKKRRRGLALASGTVRTRVTHKGIRPQAPLTAALADNANAALDAFGEVFRDGVFRAAEAAPKAD